MSLNAAPWSQRKIKAFREKKKKSVKEIELVGGTLPVRSNTHSSKCLLTAPVTCGILPLLLTGP